MTKKWGLLAVVAFGLYVVAMYFYFFYSQNSGIPAALKGTAADPSTFLTAQELVLSEDLSKIRNYLFFIAAPLEWLLYFAYGYFAFFRKVEPTKMGHLEKCDVCIFAIRSIVRAPISTSLLQVYA